MFESAGAAFAVPNRYCICGVNDLDMMQLLSNVTAFKTYREEMGASARCLLRLNVMTACGR